MKKKAEINGMMNFTTVLPGVQRISPKTYRARVQINGVSKTKVFTNKLKAHNWYKDQKRLSNTITTQSN